MALITFLSDYGYEDHYIAAVKAKIYTLNASLRVFDISHNIKSFDIAHAAYVIKNVYHEFPKGTIHLIAVNTAGHQSGRFLIGEIEGHFFITPDNGILSLISEYGPTTTIELKHSEVTTFPSKDILASAAARLASGVHISDLGPITEFDRLIDRKPKVTKKIMSGHIVRVDHYGNLITNLKKEDFDILSNGIGYNVVFGRESVNKINENYHNVDSGDCFIIFNSSGFLEIGINKGNASELLGLGYDSPVNVFFNVKE